MSIKHTHITKGVEPGGNNTLNIGFVGEYLFQRLKGYLVYGTIGLILLYSVNPCKYVMISSAKEEFD